MHIKIYLWLFLFVFITSCTGQIKPGSPKDNTNKSGPGVIKLSENDPYFIETKAINSSYGPSSITRNIIQDSNGNIWLATWEGIIRYDRSVAAAGGKSFTNFTTKEELRRFHVFSVLEDSAGYIWFGTIGAGVYRYDPAAEKAGEKSFINITSDDGLVSNSVGCIYEDKKGNIWFGTMGGVSFYAKLNKEAGELSFRNFTTTDGLTHNDVNSIIEDASGKIWIGTRGEACLYEPREDFALRKSFTKITNDEGAPFVNVRTIIEDSNRNIWLGGNDGLWCYVFASDKSGEDTFIKLSDNFVGFIYEDKQGNIWTSSEEANSRAWELSRYNLSTEKNIATLANKKVMATQIKAGEGMIFGITEDDKGGIWFGTLNGVCRYDRLIKIKDGEYFNCFRVKSPMNK